MPRFLAEEGRDFLERLVNNVMIGADNTAVLASPNRMPNPDLRDFGPDGRPKVYSLLSPDRADGFHVYAKQLTVVGADGVERAVRGEYARQNSSKLLLSDDAEFVIASSLMRGAPLPDPQKVAPIAPFLDPPDARVEPGGEALGFAAGTYPVAVAWVLGPNPKTSPRITNAGPVSFVTVGQGQVIPVDVPPNPPEGVTGVAILAGPPGGTANTMGIQEVLDVRAGVPAVHILKGPYRDPGTAARRITPTGANKTYLGNLPAPSVYWSRGDWTLKPFVTRFAYKVLTEQGWSAMSAMSAQWSSEGYWPGWGISWIHGDLKGYPGAKKWLPMFQADDLGWYTVPFAEYGGEGLPIGTAMSINQVSSKQDDWTIGGRPVRVAIDGADETGIKGPEEAVTARAQGGINLSPGKISLRITAAVGDEESAPTPPLTVTLPHALNATGGPTGTTAHVIRVDDPTEQRITNNRLTKKNPQGIDLDWTTPAVPGVVVSSEDCRAKVRDTSGAADRVVVKRSRAFELEGNRLLHTKRAVIEVLRRVSGAGSIGVEWLDAAGTLLDTDRVGRITDVGEAREVIRSMGPAGTRADLEWPTGTTAGRFCVFAEAVADADGGVAARNIDFDVGHISAKKGGGHPRKRWPREDRRDSDRRVGDRRSDPGEDPNRPYPDGPYCRVVENPTDGPRRSAAQPLEAEVTFEGVADGALPPGYAATAANGGTAGASPAAAIHGLKGLRVRRAAGASTLTSSAYAHKEYAPAGRARLAKRVWLRVGRLPTATGRHELLSVVGTLASGLPLLCAITVNAEGTLRLDAYNGAANPISTLVLARNLSKGERIKIEVEVNGAGTATATATARVKRARRFDGGAPQETAITNLNHTGRLAAGAIVGVRDAPAGSDYSFDFDDLLPTAAGEQQTEALPGNYVEYWAPEGQPRLYENFVEGGRLYFPRQAVDAGETWTFSGYLGTENSTIGAGNEPLVTTIRDEEGRVLKNNGPLCSLRGDKPWKRYHVPFALPKGASYLQIEGGYVGEGLIRAGYFMANPGPEPLPYTNTNELSGNFAVAFDTAAPKAAGEIMDLVTEYKRAEAVANHEYDAAGLPLTTVSVSIRSGRTLAELDAAPYRASLALLLAAEGIRRYVEIRVAMTSSDPTRSPEVRAVFLDAKRSVGMLYGPDGSDFPGGVLVDDFAAPQKERLVAERLYADGGYGFSEVSNEHVGGREAPRFSRGFSMRAFLDEAVDEIAELQGLDEGHFFYEDPTEDKRYKIRFFGARFGADRTGYAKGKPRVGRPGLETYSVHEATGVDALVLSEEDF